MYVYFGDISIGLTAANRVTFDTTDEFTALGSVVSVGDINHDGALDLLVGSPLAPGNSNNINASLQGKVFGILASTANTGSNSTINITFASFLQLVGPVKYDMFGAAIIVLQSRIYIGAPGHRTYVNGNSTTVGCVYVYDLPSVDVMPRVRGYVLEPVLQILGDAIFGEFGAALSGAERAGILAVSAPSAGDKLSGEIFLLNVTALVTTTRTCGSVYGDWLLGKVVPGAREGSFGRFGKTILLLDDTEAGMVNFIVGAPLANRFSSKAVISFCPFPFFL